MPTLAEYMQQAGLNDLSDPQRGGTGWAKTFRDWLTSDPSSRYGSVLPVASSTQYSNPTYLDAQGRAIHGMEVPYQERRLAMPSIGSETIGNLVNYADAPRAAAMGEFDPNTPENIEMLARGAFDAGAGGMLFNKAPAGSLRSGAIRTSTPSIEDTLRAKYPDIELDLYGDANRGLTLSKIAVPENMRDAGIGTAVMDDIIRMADAQGARLQLTPDAVYGGNVGRLKDFYKRFDFLPNKGRNKDFGTMESMVRQPQGVALTAQEQQAQSILDLLTSGNAASVTDDMLAAADQKYLYDNYDLPMDEASRLARAKDMGFGDDMYHGTRADFQNFDNRAYSAGGFGTHTGSLDAADTLLRHGQSRYVKMKGGGDYPDDASIIPLKGNIGEQVRVVDTNTWEPDSIMSNMAWDEKTSGLYDEISGDPQYPNFGSNAEKSEFIQSKLRDEGKTGFVYDNLHEGVGDSNTIFDPSNIRSQFARFDPRLSHLSNLSASGMNPLAALAAHIEQARRENQMMQLNR